MSRLGRFKEISQVERFLLLRTWLLLWPVRLSLWLLPFATTRRLVAWASQRRAASQSRCQAPERLVWAVQVAARYVPGASCLTQAMAAQILLTRNGHPADLRYGVANDAQEGFSAHAWVESNGVTVIGGSHDHYVELSSKPESSP